MLKNNYQGVGPENKLMSEAWKRVQCYFIAAGQCQRTHVRFRYTGKVVITANKITNNKITAFLKHKYKTADKLLRDIRESFGDDFFHCLTTEDELCRNTAMITLAKRLAVLNHFHKLKSQSQ